MVIVSQNSLSLCSPDIIYIKQDTPNNEFIVVGVCGEKELFLGIFTTLDAAKLEIRNIASAIQQKADAYSVREDKCQSVLDTANAK